MAQLVEKTDGVPLFVEELTQSVLDSRAKLGTSDGEASERQSTGIVIPATLHDALEARLDRSPAVREVAQVGAAIGREFQYDLLAHVVTLTTVELDAALDELAGSGLIFVRGAPPEAGYTFKHALIQDTAYDSMVRGTRHQYHRRIAQTMEERFPEILAAQPELLARHYTEAGLPKQAIPFWLKAAEQDRKSVV